MYLVNSPLIMSIDKLDFNTNANVEGEWFINKKSRFGLFFTFPSDSVLSDTSSDVDSDSWSAIDPLTLLCASIKSSFMVHEKIGDVCKALFEVPAKRKSQKPSIFGRIESEPIACESSGYGSESPQVFYYGQKSRHMMERIGYDLTKGSDLNFGKEKRALLRSFVPKGKDPN